MLITSYRFVCDGFVLKLRPTLTDASEPVCARAYEPTAAAGTAAEARRSAKGEGWSRHKPFNPGVLIYDLCPACTAALAEQGSSPEA